MRRIVRTPLVWLIVAVATGLGVLAISASTDDDQPPPQPSAGPVTPRPSPGRQHRQPAGKPRSQSTPAQVREAVGESPPAQLDATQRRVVRVVRSYVEALDARDGARACGLFVPGALATLRFPRERGECARSLSASIGYRDPRGFPVFRRSRVARVSAVRIAGDTARVTATIVTRFAGNRQPSVEDDLVYLRQAGGRWRIVKPSAVLYRAIGVGEIPPRAITPP